ncbi:unnamed protein product [Dimorphilus gyrociliatus]|uniref:G-protein coupled receptors family 1 profile domain-containing protein n=1 Tax=Dimorphilus gyrociliatus TaxID=2664684 RepID=A0A7I8VAS0_9ANNE|nr:unnamed protein product [Dimorphilus gyrociliatus]
MSSNKTEFFTACVTFDFMIQSVGMGILIVFGFTGNILSMICLNRDRSKTATPFLLISLEVADTFFLGFAVLLRVVPSTAIYILYPGEAPSSLNTLLSFCGAYVYPLALVSETTTIYLTLLVTVNRYVSVCKPYEVSRIRSVTHARRYVCLIVLLSFAINLPRFFEYDYISTENSTRSARTSMADNHVYKIVYANSIYCLVMFLVPLTTLIILNHRLIRALREARRKRAQLLNSDTSRSEDDITLVLIVVVLVFVVCQTPALATQILHSFLEDEQKECPMPYYFYERLSDFMVVVNSSLNFTIYCFCSKRFRQILKNLICKVNSEIPMTEITQLDTKIDNGTQTGRKSQM